MGKTIKIEGAPGSEKVRTTGIRSVDKRFFFVIVMYETISKTSTHTRSFPNNFELSN